MANHPSRILKKRLGSHRAGSNPRRAFGSQPFAESLEVRRLLSIVINEFGGSTPVSTPAGITTGPDGNLWFTEANPFNSGIGTISPSGTIQQIASLPLGSVPTGIVTGSDGALWFTEAGTDQIGRITTAGVVTQTNVPTASSFPDQITAGPDGALWFTEHDGNKIGQITTAGVIKEFTIPTANSQPVGITVGPDGALWFAESNTDKIGRIDTSGNITEFSNGITRNSAPTGIALGPDGALWFTELDAAQVGRITTSGVVTQFSQGITAGAGPAGITTGSDGNLWFTEQNVGKIGQITTKGVVTEFSSGSVSPTSGPAEITAGPDGNLWFTELNGNHVDKITTAGAITQYPSATNVITPEAGPVGITAGPDNALWFTEFNVAQIGRIDPSGQITEFSQGISSGANPNEITLGPVPLTGGPANLWFTETNQNVIGEITPKGVATEFPSLGSLPDGITLGPDGNLWYAEEGGAIGQITPQGIPRLFTAGLTSGFTPRFITAGPDGALWFTATSSTGGEIGRITPPTLVNPNPVITEYPVPSNPNTGTISSPAGITLGPDGNLWFADDGNQAVGMITPTATPVITEFSQGLGPNDNPYGITSGPDGNLWVTESNANLIDRVTTQGVITQFAVPTPGAFPQSITLGPDKNLWFAETNGNQIGQVVLPQSIVNATGTPATVIATVPSTFEVATFADNSAATNAANFSATIDYGDGMTGPGTILPDNSVPGTYEVFGTQTYATVNSFTAKVTISTATGSLPAVSTTVTTSSPLALTATPVDGTVGVRANTLVATFTDQDTTAIPSDFTVTVHWGDGTTTTTANVIPMMSPLGTTYFAIYDGHTYATSGSFPTSVTITDTRNSLTAQSGSSATVVGEPMYRIFNEFGPPNLTPGSGPTAITKGPDGALWFTETNSGEIGRVDTSGNVTQFKPVLPAGTTQAAVLNPGPAGIATGSDHNLWYTDPGQSQIVQLTPAGVFTFFSTGITVGSEPFGITAGPDGALWFTEAGADQIGRITTGGTVSEYSTNIASGLTPESITTGSDGNLWFVGAGSSLIGRITPQGTITEYPGATGTELTSITTGPDGDLWFTERGSNKIGKISPTTFQVTEFTDPAIIDPTQITAGPDGNLWFTEASPNAVARITTTGVVTSFTVGLTANSGLSGIVAGPDGNLYFSETAGDRIGQVILPQTSVVISAPSPSPEPAYGHSYTGVFATFTDNSPAATVANFLATIDFGDGNTGTGTIVPLMSNGVVVPGSFQVIGTNTYAHSGAFTDTITVYNDADSTSLQGTVNVQTPILVSPDNGFATLTRAFNGEIAFLQPNFQGSKPSDFSGTIDWGDGTQVAAQFIGGPNSYSVAGTKFYASAGTFNVTITVADLATGFHQTVNTTIVVAAAPTQTPINETVGTTASGSVPGVTPASLPLIITDGPDGASGSPSRRTTRSAGSPRAEVSPSIPPATPWTCFPRESRRAPMATFGTPPVSCSPPGRPILATRKPRSTGSHPRASSPISPRDSTRTVVPKGSPPAPTATSGSRTRRGDDRPDHPPGGGDRVLRRPQLGGRPDLYHGRPRRHPLVHRAGE